MNKKKIKVYSTPICPFCITLKEFLKKHGFEFEDINVIENEKAKEEMIKRSGQAGVPVFEADGRMIVGFDRKRICKILNIKD